jgi:adenylate cyclase
MRWHAGISAGLAVAVLAAGGALAQHFGVVAVWDRLVLDTAFAVWRDANVLPEDPVIVGMDEAFLERVDEPLALNHVYLGQFLRAMAAAQPRVIGLDIALPEKRFESLTLSAQPGLDLHKTLLAALLATSGELPVVAAKVWDFDRNRFRDIHVDYAAVLAMQERGATAHASALFCQDPDGRVRRYPGPDCQPAGVQTTFSSEVAAAMGARGAWSGLIDYRQGAPFTYIPLRHVLDLAERGDEAALQRLFRARAVLFGTILEDIDQIAVPVNLSAWRPESHRVPGVVVHAQAVRNMLGGGLLQPAPSWVLYAMLPLFALLWVGGAMLRKLALFAVAVAALLALAQQLLLRGVWLAPGSALLTGAAACAARGALEGWRGWRERQRLAQTFSGYVSPSVMREILAAGDSQQQGRKLTVCVLFSDIRDFTALSESLPPEDVVRLLNRYFARMTPLVHRHGGTVDKFIGDGLMAFFGAPNVLAAPARNALDSARDMLDALVELNREFASEGRGPLEIGIGLHLGDAVIGSIGSAERHAYTAIGDTVNTASRIEGLCRGLGCQLICSEAVALALGSPAELAPLGPQAIKGRSPVPVYGLRRSAQNASQDARGALQAVAQGLPGAATAP